MMNKNRLILFIIAIVSCVLILLFYVFKTPDKSILTINTGSRVSGFDISSDGLTIVSVGQNTPHASLWEFSSGKMTGQIPLPETGAIDVAFVPHRRVVSIPWTDGSVRFFNIDNGAEVDRLEINPKSTSNIEDGRFPGLNLANALSNIEFSPDGDTLAASEFYGPVWIWSISKHKLLFSLYDGTIANCKSAEPIAFSLDSKFVSVGCEASNSLVWRLSDGKLMYNLSDKTMRRWVHVAFSAKGFLATGGDFDTVQLWSIRGGKLIATLSEQNSGALSLSFNSSGNLIAVGGGNIPNDGNSTRSYDTKIRLWNTDTKTILARFAGHTLNVTKIMFIDNDHHIVSSSEDGTIKIWEVPKI